MRLVFLGPPAAGKGTQARKLAEQKGWPHLSSGDILRDEARAASTLGRKAAGFMNAGQLVPDDLVVALMVERISRPDCRDGFVLDGFPRTTVQAEALEAALAEADRPLDAAISFTCSDAEVLRRITGRWTCPRCGAIYHAQSIPPRQVGLCDACGSALVQRKDDTAEVAAERLAAYRRQTEPLVGYYRDRGLLRTIDAAQPIEAIWNRLGETVERLAGAASARPARG